MLSSDRYGACMLVDFFVLISFGLVQLVIQQVLVNLISNT